MKRINSVANSQTDSYTVIQCNNNNIPKKSNSKGSLQKPQHNTYINNKKLTHQATLPIPHTHHIQNNSGGTPINTVGDKLLHNKAISPPLVGIGLENMFSNNFFYNPQESFNNVSQSPSPKSSDTLSTKTSLVLSPLFNIPISKRYSPLTRD